MKIKPVHNMYSQLPIRSLELTKLAKALLSESTHLLGNEQMAPASNFDGQRGMQLSGIEVKVRRARALVDEQPGTAYSLTLDALGQLDALARAREAAQGW